MKRNTPAGGWTRQRRIDTFCERLRSVRAEVHLTSPSQWAERLLQLCREKGLGNLLYAADGPLAPAIDAVWENADAPPERIRHATTIEQWKPALFADTEAAVTSVRAGIADVSALVLWPTPQEPRSYSLVPPVHFAVLHAGQLYHSFAEVVEQEQWHTGMPSNALLISGPSKSADIEQTLAYGVHGPMQLIVLLLI
ncbi:MAG: lactate utilization protein [Candidatus Sedimenticola endophacoides]|uniref:Lactate utilization protein n=2 Tax=Candidatus Sedimenticola endophacoides TaxID=2548426 RepID=A0A6N4E6Y3_9GAMM|nr:MAG: lactate utilization protein [Candidatus Sedimenticola endophacoides]PUE04742.1 MAG: lactate utilization protein [Candidatus Sedimenticola endophacoides]PUE05632.1 MAG: lactate utilization protein [Candidatus Sedimenticola endophacoides]